MTAVGVATPPGLYGQSGSACFSFWQALGGTHLDLDRVEALSGLRPSGTEALYRAGEAVARECVASAPTTGSRDTALSVFRFAPLPAVAFVQLNTGYPRLRRDGLAWGGRGMGAALTAGVHARWGPVSGALAPVFVGEENRSFAYRRVGVPGLSPYASYFHPGVIDLPQRFGKEGLAWLHPGQSYLRVDGFGATAGVSTETLRWGPARRNPLLMSGAAPGFFHAFLGTSRPADVGIGRVEVEAIWGRLHESEFFDEDENNDARLLAGLLVAFSPGNAGLTLGAARSYSRYLPSGGLPLLELVLGPYVNVRDNPTGAGADNQLISAFFRWAFPEVGFEVYGEYARDDHWEDLRDLFMEPDHSRAYTVGLQNVFTLREPGRRLRVAAEATNLNSSPTWQSGRGSIVDFYTHSAVRQGHTHRGQHLGAPIGTGSDSQYLAADYMVPRWLVGLHLERVRYDNDAYYRYFRYPYTTGGHDAEWTVALRGGAFSSSAQVVGEIGYSTRHNRGFVHLPGTLTTTIENNLNLRVGVAWTPGGDRNDP